MRLKYYDIQWQVHTLPIVYSDKGLVYVGAFDELEWEAKQFLDAKQVHTWLKGEANTIYEREILEYLNGERSEWSFEVHWIVGTAFQREVWEALQQVPFGTWESYSDIAQRIQRPQAVRAVGAAIGHNPLTIVVPCHRILSKKGALTGFRGGLSMKRQLLEIEGILYFE